MKLLTSLSKACKNLYILYELVCVDPAQDSSFVEWDFRNSFQTLKIYKISSKSCSISSVLFQASWERNLAVKSACQSILPCQDFKLGPLPLLLFNDCLFESWIWIILKIIFSLLLSLPALKNIWRWGVCSNLTLDWSLISSPQLYNL